MVTRAPRATPRNRAAILLAVLSIVLLIPGLVEPALTIKSSMEVFGNVRELSNETRSVLSAVRSLHQSGNDFVAGLILLFSVVVPFAKAALLVPMFTWRDHAARYRMYTFVRAISKWSMADVFAVGMLIALLVAKGTAHLAGIAGPGFYYFAAYCLVSNAAFQALRLEPRAQPGAHATSLAAP